MARWRWHAGSLPRARRPAKPPVCADYAPKRLRRDRVDVQSHVVERRALAQAGEDGVDERVAELVGETVEVGAEVDRPQVLARVVGLDRAVGEPAARLAEAGGAQAALGVLRRREVPRPLPALEVRAERRVGRGLARRRVDRRDVARAAALGDEAAPRPQRAPQRGEQRVVVGDPVERRGREDDVDGLAAEVEADEVGDAQSASSPRRVRAASIIEADTSTPITRPRGTRSISSSVSRPEPQPASSTVSSPRSSRRSITSRPISSIGVESRS